METRLDGNAAGGILQSIFPFDMTTAQCICAGCGERNELGATMAYMHGMGTILRCPACDFVLIRVAEIEGHWCLDMRGIRLLRMQVV